MKNRQAVILGGVLMMALVSTGCSHLDGSATKSDEETNNSTSADRNEEGELDLTDASDGDTGPGLDLADCDPVSLSSDLVSSDYTLEDHPLYVNASADLSLADGSRWAPFGSIQQALDHLTGPSVIFVAIGEYEGDFTLPAGVLLFGGYDPHRWEKDLGVGRSIIRNRRDEITIEAGEGPANVVEGFEIHGATEEVLATIELTAGARAIIRGNTIASTMIAMELGPGLYGETHLGNAVWGNAVTLLMEYNLIIVPSDTPEHVISSGLYLLGSCALIRDNELESFRTPIQLRQSHAIISANRINHGLNGIAMEDSSPKIHCNEIQIEEPDVGCVYAIYMEGESHPEIECNTITLLGSRAKGINESDSPGSDPAVLRENRFFVTDPAAALYMDRDQPADVGRVNHSLFDIDEVNGLLDIPSVGGNTLEVID